MKVILREDVPDIGTAGQTVEVKDGYGRNFLIPRNLAIPATRGNLDAIGEVTKQKDLRERKSRREAEVVKDKIEKLSLSAEVLVVELMEKEGVTVPKHAVQLDSPIKVLGVYTIPVKIEKDVVAELKLWVVKKSQ